MSTFFKSDYKYLLLLIGMVIAHVLLGYFIPRESTVPLFTAFGVLFILYYIIFRQQITERQFQMLIGGAVLLRLVWLFAFPNLSDDYARFVWDGRLTIAGYNPLKYLPSQIMQSGLRSFHPDPVLYKAMNSQGYYTCYPPLLQSIFAIAAFIFPNNTYGDIIILRSFNLVADTGTIFLLISLCKRWKLDNHRVLLYALNPIVIAELTGNLHYEGMLIFFLVSTIYCWERGLFWVSILLFTGSVITKLVPLMLLPLAFFYLQGWKGTVFTISVILLTAVSFLPFIDTAVAHKFWSSINSYFQESEFNASIYYLVRDSVQHFTKENDIEVIGPVLTIFSGIIVLGYAFWKRRKMNVPSLLKYCSWTMLIYYAFTTTVFPWYITPIIAFGVFTGYLFPLVWSATIMLSYYADRNASFEESTILLWIEYLALLLALIWDIYSEHRFQQLHKVENLRTNNDANIN
jgi:alpha-1,6-mannosyltransferase